MAKSATVPVTSAATERVKGSVDRVKSFYTDVRTEMKKVTSPSRKEVQATTAVVIITVFLFGAYFAVVDFAIGHSIDKLLRYFSHR
jgi:preprotein translocase subunit SecE